MSGDNSVCISGTLGKPIELRFTSGGTATANLSVAVRRSWQNKTTKAWEEETSWIYVVLWGTTAENAAESFHVGDRVIVSGRIAQRSYEASDGTKKSAVEVVADEIGASMRFATAVVSRTERQTDQKPTRTAKQPAPGSYDYQDAEPF